MAQRELDESHQLTGTDHMQYRRAEPSSFEGPFAPEGRSVALPAGEGSGTWLYLGFLGLLFLVLVVFSFACEDRSPSLTGAGAIDEATSELGGSARVLVDIDRGVVTVDGVVPDQASRDAVINAAALQYGPENIVDELDIDPSVNLEGGVLTLAGRADVGDRRPQDLEQGLQVALDLSMTASNVARIEPGNLPAEFVAQLDGDRVVLSGSAPDDEAQSVLLSAANATWGADNVDSSGLIVGDTALEGASLILRGTAAPGDVRYQDFERVVSAELGEGLVLVSQVVSSIPPEQLAELETRIQEVVNSQPILFEPRSAEIDSASDAVLQRVAELLEEIPAVPVEIVGHTDSEGDETENLTLSQQRAAAVLTRLEDLNIDGARLTSRGEGEARPIASNDDPESRALNRRIEFLVVGAADS